MDSNRWKKISQILDVALSYPGEKRTTYIQEVCGDDSILLNEVNKLLESLNDSDLDLLTNQIENNAALIQSVLNTDNVPAGDIYLNGKQIGSWTLNELTGSGGMGSVYKAIRTGENGIHQTGALKIIHKSLVTSSHIDRFRLEQQILSRLEHPNIARFIDSGITPDGVPYMVMEYVEGDPILDYCDRHQLSVQQRLELFKTVCKTVQYAHKSLVVHRDLKSDNIFVTSDGVVKILDFGIAKLLDTNMDEYSRIQTQPGTRLLSLEYASPEQVRGELVTTSTDIYSLGILCYKLLVGLHPFDTGDLSWHDVELLIKGEDVPLPSQRFFTCPSDEKKNLIAEKRKEEPSGLVKKVRGDLDAIIRKCLRKDPERRYESVITLATDLERHQKLLPILARPDSYAYRMRKFIHRQRLGVTAALLLLIVLIIGITATLWQANQAQQNARLAELEAQRAGQITEFLVKLFETSDPAVAQGRDISSAEILANGIEKAQQPGLDPQLQSSMLSTLGQVYLARGEYEQSIDLLQQAVALIHEDPLPGHELLMADIQTNLGLNHRFLGNLEIADSLLQDAFENRKSILGTDHPETISSLDNWAAVKIYRTRDLKLADSLFTDVLNRRRRVSETTAEDLAESLNNLGYIKTRRGEFEEALKLYDEASDIYRTTLGDRHPASLRVMSSIAFLYHKLGDVKRSEKLRRETIDIRREVLGEDHPHLAMSYYYLAELLQETGRSQEALKSGLEAVRIMEGTGSSMPAYPDALVLLANIFHNVDDLLSAGDTYHKASSSCEEQRGVNTPFCYELNLKIGEFYVEQDEYNNAIEYLNKSYLGMLQSVDMGDPKILKAEELLNNANRAIAAQNK